MWTATLTTVGRRSCSAIALASAVLHTFSLGASERPVAAVLSVLMIGGCMSCAWDLWRHDTIRAWLTVAVMNLAMIGMHLPASAGHHHSGGTATPLPVVMAWATGLALVEAGAATVGLYLKTRGSYPDQCVDPAAGEVQQESRRHHPQQRADLAALARGGAHDGP